MLLLLVPLAATSPGCVHSLRAAADSADGDDFLGEAAAVATSDVAPPRQRRSGCSCKVERLILVWEGPPRPAPWAVAHSAKTTQQRIVDVFPASASRLEIGDRCASGSSSL
jgi:hypothetical protein